MTFRTGARFNVNIFTQIREYDSFDFCMFFLNTTCTKTLQELHN
jgi:hypothetical protein